MAIVLFNFFLNHSYLKFKHWVVHWAFCLLEQMLNRFSLSLRGHLRLSNRREQQEP